MFAFYIVDSNSIFFCKFLTGEEPLGEFTVNKPLLLLLLLLLLL